MSGVPPGTNPTHGSWLLGWTAGLTDYTADINAHDMAGIPAAAWNQGAKQCDILIQERNGTQPLYFAVFTAETHDPANPPGATWGLFPGIQFALATGAGTGYWFFPLDVTNNAPPVGDGWRMPADGSGAFMVSCSRDAAGTVPATLLQFGLWGTGDHLATPPNPPMVGTEGSLLWADESTPPNCGAGSLATNVPNHLLDSAACESYAATFATDPTPLATSIGFGMVLGGGGSTGSCCLPNHTCSVVSQTDCGTANGTYNGDGSTCPGTCSLCYTNCDNSTTVPFLNVQDFSCFLTKYASGSLYANCDSSTQIPVLNVQDFSCFLTKYATGCSAP